MKERRSRFTTIWLTMALCLSLVSGSIRAQEASPVVEPTVPPVDVTETVAPNPTEDVEPTTTAIATDVVTAEPTQPDTSTATSTTAPASTSTATASATTTATATNTPTPILTAPAFGTLSIFSADAAGDVTPVPVGDKVTICHFNGPGQGSGKYVRNSVAASSIIGSSGHINHPLDVIPPFVWTDGLIRSTGQVDTISG